METGRLSAPDTRHRQRPCGTGFLATLRDRPPGTRGLRITAPCYAAPVATEMTGATRARRTKELRHLRLKPVSLLTFEPVSVCEREFRREKV
jgi:hypothetical protein